MNNDMFAYLKSREAWGRIIAKHYGLDRAVTLAEVKAEIANLNRRKIAGTLDDNQAMLAAKLHII